MKALIKQVEATEVVAHDVSPLTVNTDARAYTRLGWFIVLAGVLGFVLWASWAPLDKGVPLQGTVSKESNRKAIQHLTGGIVDEILVKDGDLVKAGQVLVRMNGVQVKSISDITRIQLVSSRAVEARLVAERDNAASIKFPKDLLEQKSSDPRIAGVIDGQSMLFQTRRMALQNDLSATDDNIAGIKVQTKGIEESLESKRVQLAIVKEQLDNIRDLAKDGYVPRTRLLDMERTFAQLNGAIAEDIGNIGRARQQVSELGRRREQRAQEFQREVRTTLADVQKEGQALTVRSGAQEYELANTDVKSPVEGVVTGINVFTRGGVIGPGFKMMDVVPVKDALVVEGILAVNLIDKVHPGLEVELIFSAFNASTTPHISGEIIQVAADRTIDEHSGMPYYKIKARVTKEGLKTLSAHKLEVRPGMPVDMFVKTGERTMMNYLFKPLVDRAHSALTEE